MRRREGTAVLLLACSIFYGNLLARTLEKVRVSPSGRDECLYWVYEAIEHLKTSGTLQGNLTSSRPMSRLELARIIGQVSEEGLSPYDLWLLRRLRVEFGRELILLGLPADSKAREPTLEIERGGDILSLDDMYLYEDGALSAEDGRTELISELNLRMGMEFGDRIAFYDRAILHAGNVGGESDTQPIVGPIVPDFEIFIEEAYLSFKVLDFDVDIGKERLKWGPGYHGNLLISKTSVPLDLIRISKKWGPAKLTFMSSYFERNKFLSAQRIEMRISPWLFVGISEAAVYSGRPSPQYLNPILPYYLSQRYFGEGDDNICGLLDFELLPLTGVRVYGEILNDDYVVDPPDVPDKWGFLVGGHLRPLCILPSSRIDSWIRLEYAQIQKWVYTHRSVVNCFSFSDTVLIGHFIGPDADLFGSEIGLFFSPNISLKAFYRFARKGEGTIDDPWVRGQDHHPPFPSGTVEVQNQAGLKCYLYPFQRLEVALSGIYSNFRNRGNQADADEEIETLQLQLFYHF